MSEMMRWSSPSIRMRTKMYDGITDDSRTEVPPCTVGQEGA